MTSRPTPGPWEWGKRKLAEQPVGTLYGANGIVVCDFGDGTQFYPSEGEMPNEADARLIAAAPDLLEALQHLNIFLSWDYVEFKNRDRDLKPHALEVIRDAMAKATGGTHD